MHIQMRVYHRWVYLSKTYISNNKFNRHCDLIKANHMCTTLSRVLPKFQLYQKLFRLCQILNDVIIYCVHWGVKTTRVRTNNNIDGWHSKLKRVTLPYHSIHLSNYWRLNGSMLKLQYINYSISIKFEEQRQVPRRLMLNLNRSGKDGKKMLYL